MMLLTASCSHSVRQNNRIDQLLRSALEVESGNPVDALDIYEQALDEQPSKLDTAQLRTTYFRMGLLFLRNGLAEECIESMHEAYYIDSLTCDTTGMLYSLRYMALALESRGRIDLARDTLRRVVMELPDISSEEAIDYGSFFSFHLRAYMLEDYYKRYEQLIADMRELPETHRRYLTHLTPVSNELELAYMAWKAQREQNPQEAIRCYEEMTSKLSPYIRAFALIRLMELRLQCGQTEEAAYCLKRYEFALNEMHRGDDISKRLIQHHAYYQRVRAHRQISRLQWLNERQLRIFLTALVACLLVIAVLILSVRNHRHRQALLKLKVDKLNTLNEAYQAQAEEERKRIKQGVEQSNIRLRLKKWLESETAHPLTEETWEELEQTVLELFPLFRERLHDLCRPSTHEYRVCLLLKIGMKPGEIARLTFHSNEAISSTRRRLYVRTTNIKGSPSEWDKVIATL